MVADLLAVVAAASGSKASRRWRSSLVGLTAWRRPRAAFARGVVAALLIVALLDPALQREDRRPLKDVVAVVIDRSAGNRLGERERQTDAARAEIEKRLAALDNVEAHFVETPRDDPDNHGTQLFAALRQALSETPPERVGGAIIVTDGIAHDIPASADALGFHAPLHVLVTGHEGERDRRIELVEAPRFGIVGKEQTIAARVLDSDAGSAPAQLTVRRDGQPLATYTAPIGETLKIPAPIEHAGANIFELEVAPAPDELTTLDNKAVATIEGVRDKLRVLLVSGEPHPGERMWRNLLKSDANVDLVHFTILRPPEKTTDGAPINELSLIAFPVADLFGHKIKRFRSHHLRPLFEPGDPAARLSRQYRQICARRRGAASRGGAGIRHAGGPLHHPARRDLAGAPDRRGFRGAVPRRRQRRRRQASGHARASRRRRQSAGVGPLVPQPRRRSDERRQRDAARGQRAAAAARARRQGAGRAAPIRPDVAVGARL